LIPRALTGHSTQSPEGRQPWQLVFGHRHCVVLRPGLSPRGCLQRHWKLLMHACQRKLRACQPHQPGTLAHPAPRIHRQPMPLHGEGPKGQGQQQCNCTDGSAPTGPTTAGLETAQQLSTLAYILVKGLAGPTTCVPRLSLQACYSSMDTIRHMHTPARDCLTMEYLYNTCTQLADHDLHVLAAQPQVLQARPHVHTQSVSVAKVCTWPTSLPATGLGHKQRRCSSP
jgi:hypothetical protein